jgi:hypothetical protein
MVTGESLLQIIRDAKGCKWITGREPHADASCVRFNQDDLEMIERALVAEKSLWRRLVHFIWK